MTMKTESFETGSKDSIDLRKVSLDLLKCLGDILQETREFCHKCDVFFHLFAFEIVLFCGKFSDI